MVKASGLPIKTSSQSRQAHRTGWKLSQVELIMRRVHCHLN